MLFFSIHLLLTKLVLVWLQRFWVGKEINRKMNSHLLLFGWNDKRKVCIVTVSTLAHFPQSILSTISIQIFTFTNNLPSKFCLCHNPSTRIISLSKYLTSNNYHISNHQQAYTFLLFPPNIHMKIQNSKIPHTKCTQITDVLSNDIPQVECPNAIRVRSSSSHLYLGSQSRFIGFFRYRYL